jgi:predicted transcriptional regulator
METKPIKTIIGEVMDKTENSLQIKKIWIKFFDSELIKDTNVNDNVEVKFQDNEKN